MTTQSKSKSKSTSTSKRKRSSASSKPAASSQARAKTLREQFADWPRKGDDRPQPWDYRAHGIDPNAVGDGEPDLVSPVDPRPGLPILATGMAGEAVRELGQRLADAGYDNSVVHGDNPFAVYDDSVAHAVERFRSDYGLEEPPTEALGGNTRAGEQQRDAHVGPYTQEAIHRVSDQARAERAKERERGVPA